MTFPPELLSLLLRTEKLVALTGAGVSQESGLRTFRDAQTGLWAQYKPEELASPEAFERDPKLIWDWYAWRREAVKAGRPNPGHYALAEMEKRALAFTLITQNVDGLHRMAGSQNMLELHGNIQRVRCADCYTFTETWGDDTESVPRCKECGGLLRPDVVWFGEALPRDQLLRSLVPIYLGRTASFVMATRRSDADEVEARIQALAEEYVAQKPYLLHAWSRAL